MTAPTIAGRLLKRLFCGLAHLVTQFVARAEAQHDLDLLLDRLPSLIDGKLRPVITRADLLRFLHAVEPIEIHEDGPVRFRRNLTEVAQELALIDPSRP